MSAALWFRRCLGFCIGMCFSSLGLALITNTNLGTTPITSLPVALNALVPLSIGGYTVIVSVLFIGVEKLILGKHFSLANILQMPPVFLFGLPEHSRFSVIQGSVVSFVILSVSEGSGGVYR